MKLITKNIEDPKYTPDITNYLARDGYQALERALEMGPEGVITEVKKSRLLGRGGAVFPTSSKWEFVHVAEDHPKYVVCNADEGEPGAFKDRLILERDPHLLLEGMTICGWATNAEKGYIYIRGEYLKAYETLKKAITEAKERNFLGRNILDTDFSFDVAPYRGAGSYVCGEETALLNSLEGKRGFARLKPPFPTTQGFRDKPTVINNVETLANIPAIILKGGDWYSKIGSKDAPGTKLYCVSGDIEKPGVYELPTDTNVEKLLETAGGVRGELKAVLPSGISSGLLTGDELGSRIEFGLGATIVMNTERCMVDLARRCIEFYCYESCGKCAPCREGTLQSRNILRRIAGGRGRMEDLDLLKELQKVMMDTAICGLGQAALNMVISATKKFREEFEEHIAGKCRTGVCTIGG